MIAYNEPFDRRMVNDSCGTNGLPNISHKSKTWQCAMRRYSHFNLTKLTKNGKPGGWWKLEEAMKAQRNGDIRTYSQLSVEADALAKQLEALEESKS